MDVMPTEAMREERDIKPKQGSYVKPPNGSNGSYMVDFVTEEK